MSNLGPLQTNGATELTAEGIEALLAQFTFLGSRLLVDATITPIYTSRVNQYSDALVPYNTETTILSHLVASNLDILGMECWGDTNGEFFIKVDGTIVGGSRTTAAVPTCSTDYLNAPIQVNAGSIVTITATHYVPTTHTMRANLFGGVI